MLQIDLSQFATVEELQKLARDIEAEIERRQEVDRERLMAQVRDAATRYGMSVEEFFERPAKKRRTRPEPKYRNPNNPKQTWSGRGKQPDWVQHALAAGQTLPDLEIR